MSIDELTAKYANMSDMLIDMDAEAEGKFLVLHYAANEKFFNNY